MLLYVGGEGGVGKSQVIKAIVAGMDLIHRKGEVILMAPTGAATNNIGGKYLSHLLRYWPCQIAEANGGLSH